MKNYRFLKNKPIQMQLKPILKLLVHIRKLLRDNKANKANLNEEKTIPIHVKKK